MHFTYVKCSIFICEHIKIQKYFIMMIKYFQI